MIEATVHLTRALAYLAAETDDPTDLLSGQDLERWTRFVEPTWQKWVAAFGRAAAANTPMPVSEIAGAIEELSALAPDLMRSVGFEREIGPHGESAWWLNEFEW